MTSRRSFLTRSAAATASALAAPAGALAHGEVHRIGGTRVKLALNAYSFNQPLRDGELTLMDVADYCGEHGLDALDATGYYFPGYPDPPSDEFVYALKKRAFLNGLVINGTGVRNDFAVADTDARKRDVQMVKNWIEVASKLGASVIRLFAGREVPEGHTFDQALEWMIPHFKECAAYAEQHGVIIGLQNHNDFIKTAEETIRIVDAVDSDWFGVILDVGSLRQSDPYEEIERLVPYAVSWQLKEELWYGEKAVPTDLKRIKAIIDRVGYRGFLPIETLGPGDPRVKVAKYAADAHAVFGV